MNWTDEQMEVAKRLSLETSASAIARELSKKLRPGTTRNAVIGMLDRLRAKGETVQLNREAAAGRAARKASREEARKAKEIVRQAAAKERERVRRQQRERLDRIRPEVATATVHDWDQVFGTAPGGVRFAQVAIGQCKWPLEGRGPSMRCCGRHTSGIYCETHAATAVDRRAA